MTKKTKSKNTSKRKRAREKAVRKVLSSLEEMIKIDSVQVTVLGPLFTLTFEATLEKHEVEGWYTLSREGFDINIAPELSEIILFSPEGGVFMSRKGMAITIELEARSAEEILARYPGASKLIH